MNWKLLAAFVAMAWGSPSPGFDRGATTEAYLQLLRGTRYYDVLDERIHGWPAADGRHPWFGIWWTAVQIEKGADGSLSYRHHPMGSDNAASDTAFMLENSCYAWALWHRPEAARALHELIRGMSAQILAMEGAGDSHEPLCARAFYPESVTTRIHGVTVRLNYDLARPGTDNSASEYVHIPDNPYWGDIWVKNKRSKDDMGNVLQALLQVKATCADPGWLTEPMAGDFSRALELYRGWARTVRADGWRIATLDQSARLVWPWDTLANYFPHFECPAAQVLSWFGSGGTGGYDCGDGVDSLVNWFSGFNHQNLGILESYHQAALAAALESGRADDAERLRQGLAVRLRKDFDGSRAQDRAGFALRDGIFGGALTFGDSEALSQAILQARDSYLAPERSHLYDALTAPLSPGLYPYTPRGRGLAWRDIGQVIGWCVSPYADRNAAPIDCDRLLAGD